MKKLIPILTIALVLTACGDSADPVATTAPTTAPTVAPPTDSAPTLAPRPTGTDAKMNSHLYSAFLMAGEGVALDDIAASVSELQFDENGVLVEVTLDAVNAEAAAALAAAGLNITEEYPDLLMITGSISPADLSDLAALDAVVSLTAAFGATTG